MTSLYPNEYTAPKLTGVVDFSTTSAPVLTVRDLFGNDVPNDTLCKLAHDGEYLYVFFRSYFKERPQPTFNIHGNKVFRDDCVEIFIGNKSTYFELDVSAYNVIFEAIIKNNNMELEIDERQGLTKTTSEIFDEYYEVNYVIPLKSLEVFGELYFNVFRVEMVDGKRTSRSASKTDNLSHHVTDAFIKLKLEK